MSKDINGVEYAYENKDELAFGTYYEDEIIVCSIRTRSRNYSISSKNVQKETS